MISGGRAASISERESSLAFLKMTHYSTQPLRPHRRGRQGHPSMLPATKRWGRRLEGPLAEVARTASAFLARSAEGEAPSYGSNAAALSLYSQQRWRRVLTRVLVPTCFASTCCHGASAPRAMIQSPWPERCGSQRPMGRCAGRHAQALHRSEHWRREHSFPHSVVVVLSARTARTAIQRLVDGAQSPRGSASRAHRKAPPPHGPARWTVFVAGVDSLLFSVSLSRMR